MSERSSDTFYSRKEGMKMSTPYYNTNDMTPGVAAKIQRIFGPCTLVYECYTTDDIHWEYHRLRHMASSLTIGEYVNSLIDTQDAHNEQLKHAAREQEESGSDRYPKGYHAKVIKECNDQVSGIRDRCISAGLLPSS